MSQEFYDDPQEIAADIRKEKNPDGTSNPYDGWVSDPSSSFERRGGLPPRGPARQLPVEILKRKEFADVRKGIDSHDKAVRAREDADLAYEEAEIRYGAEVNEWKRLKRAAADAILDGNPGVVLPPAPDEVEHATDLALKADVCRVAREREGAAAREVDRLIAAHYKEVLAASSVAIPEMALEADRFCVESENVLDGLLSLRRVALVARIDATKAHLKEMGLSEDYAARIVTDLYLSKDVALEGVGDKRHEAIKFLKSQVNAIQGERFAIPVEELVDEALRNNVKGIHDVFPPEYWRRRGNQK